MAISPTPEEAANHGLSRGGDTAGALRPLEEEKEEEDSGMALEGDPTRGLQPGGAGTERQRGSEEGLGKDGEEEGEKLR